MHSPLSWVNGFLALLILLCLKQDALETKDVSREDQIETRRCELMVNQG